MSPPQERASTREAGFSIIELLIVFVILGIVVNIAIPVYGNAKLKARATKIVTDFKLLESAVTNYYTQNGSWPRDRSPGREPPELKDYLDGGLDWGRRGRRGMEIQYEWDNWLRKNGKPKKARTGVAIGFSVRTRDSRMLAMLEQVWGQEAYATRDRLTFIIVPADRPPRKKPGKRGKRGKRGR